MTTATMNRSAANFVRPAQVAKRASSFSIAAFFDVVSQSLAMARAIPDNGSVRARDIAKVRAMAETM